MSSIVEPERYAQLKQEIIGRIAADRAILDQLRTEIRPLTSQVRRIQARSTTSISLVAADGGNNSVRFDPFLIELVRVVDSNNEEYCLETITPTTSIAQLNERQFHRDGSPQTALGEMMHYLGVRSLQQLSHYIRDNRQSQPVSPAWIKVYRELVEWATLFSLMNRNFGTDTIIIFDGLLRSTVFSGNYFQKYLQGISERIALQQRRHHRMLYLTGVAKHSKVLSRYHLAMALEHVLTTSYPAYLAIPAQLEQKAYTWTAYAAESDQNILESDISQFVGGKMYFVKFGSSPRDPIWPVDIFLPQKDQHAHILGCMLADALDGFPVPLYPRSLQKAHANAALADFDFDIVQNYIFDGIRQTLEQDAAALDTFRLQEADPSQRRYE